MVRVPAAVQDLGWAALLVPLSSWFGLTRMYMFSEPGNAWHFFAEVWADRLFADIVFTVGTFGVGVGILAILRHGPWRRAWLWWTLAASLAVASYFANWVVYAASFESLSNQAQGGQYKPAHTFSFVEGYGRWGLAFCSAGVLGLAAIVQKRTAKIAKRATDAKRVPAVGPRPAATGILRSPNPYHAGQARPEDPVG